MKSITMFAHHAHAIFNGDTRFDVRPAPPAGLVPGVASMPGPKLAIGERIAVHTARSRLRRRVDNTHGATVGDPWPPDPTFWVRIVNDDGTAQIEYGADINVLCGSVIIDACVPLTTGRAPGPHIHLGSAEAVTRGANAATLVTDGAVEDISPYRTPSWTPGKWVLIYRDPERFTDRCPTCRGHQTAACPLCYDPHTGVNQGVINPIEFNVDHQINTVPESLIPELTCNQTV